MFRFVCLLCLALPSPAADFSIASYGLSSSNFSLTFPTQPGRTYVVERVLALGQPWTISATYCGTGSLVTFIDGLRPGPSFYRVNAAPSPPLQLSPNQPRLASNAVSLPDATIGQSYAMDISACPSGTAPFSFQITGSPPTGLTLNITPDSVQVRGVAVSPVRTQFAVSVTDAANASVTNIYDLRAINPPPVILTQSVALKAGRQDNISLQASNGTGALTWSLVSGSLPEGMDLSAAGILAGTPTPNTAEFNETGQHTTLLRVTDQHTDRLTGAPAPRSATGTVIHRVGLSYSLNIYAQRVNGPSFSARCIACHGEFFPPNFDSDNAAAIIGVASNPTFYCPNRVYIIPTDPERSLIYKKVTAPPCGERMPQGGPFMNTTESNRLLRWIVELQNGDVD